jgi:hypothetical protein
LSSAYSIKTTTTIASKFGSLCFPFSSSNNYLYVYFQSTLLAIIKLSQTPKQSHVIKNYGSEGKPSERVEHHHGDASVVTATRFGLIIPFRRYVIVERPRRKLHQPFSIP